MIQTLILVFAITYIAVQMLIIVGVIYLLYIHYNVLARLTEILMYAQQQNDDEYPEYPPVNGFE